MPFPTLASLPDAVKKLPQHGQEIYQSAFNSAFEQTDDEARSHAIAWAAVKMKFRQNEEGNWVAKETKEAIMLSAEDKRGVLQTAVSAIYSQNEEDPVPHGVTIEDVYETELIYNVNGQSYKASYTLDEAGIVTMGEPVKVVKQTVYKPLESLQTTYSEIIQEAGRRNATLDAARVKKIVALCQELLSSEKPDEEEVVKATKEAADTLEWLKEQAMMKTEGSHKYPIEAYIHAPNKFKPGSWQLRIWEDPDKKVTKGQLAKVASALSPNGWAQGKVSKEDIPGIKRALRAAYRKLGVETKDMPESVSESESREYLNSYVPLTEATFDKGRATVIVIKPGFNATEDRYYPAEVLKRDFGIFEGQKMYADHPTEEEDKARPERSIRDWVATLSSVTVDEAGVVTGIAEVHEGWLKAKLASLGEKGMLPEMGISINAVGSATKGTIDGKETLVIEKLVAARSVDFVTEPGAGGIVTFYESDRRNVDLLDLSTLTEVRPDLIAAIEAKVRNELKMEEGYKAMSEERIKELEGEITTLTTERDTLKEATEKAEKEKIVAEAQIAIKASVDKAELPDAAKERLIERFKGAEKAEGIEEAITSEKDYIAKLTEAGKVKGLGGSTPSTEKSKEALVESMKALGLDEESAKVAAAGR